MQDGRSEFENVLLLVHDEVEQLGRFADFANRGEDERWSHEVVGVALQSVAELVVPAGRDRKLEPQSRMNNLKQSR